MHVRSVEQALSGGASEGRSLRHASIDRLPYDGRDGDAPLTGYTSNPCVTLVIDEDLKTVSKHLLIL